MPDAQKSPPLPDGARDTTNFLAVRQRIYTAARRVGRSGSDVLLVAVSKTVSAQTLISMFSRGGGFPADLHLGENYAQEMRDKTALLSRKVPAAINWHFVGRLQKNKVKYVVGKCVLIHSVDSFGLAAEIDKRAGSGGTGADVLIEINQGDSSKGGVAPEEAKELLGRISALKNTTVRGFMSMPPYFDDPEYARPHFVQMRELRDSLLPDFPQASHLSMGMSADFEVAVEEGATIVRVGSLIFGERS